MKNIFRALFAIAVLAMLSRTDRLVFGQAPPASSILSGEEIIKRSKELLYRIEDQKNKVNLRLIDQDGTVKDVVAQRYWKNYRNRDGFSGKTIIFTEIPADLRGQAILIWDYSTEGKAEDLWLYLPALRNTRRVPPQAQDEAFMGSDLTFADMGQRRLDEDVHKALGEETVRGVPSYVVESVPKDKDSIYGKKVSWVSKNDYTIQKIDYYDRSGKLLKNQTIDWQVLQEKQTPVYVWKTTEVTNVQRKHKTIFTVSELKINIGLADGDFTDRMLKIGLRK